MEKLSILGATGSIGTSTLSVLRNYPGRFELTAISGYKNLNRLAEIITEFKPAVVGLTEDDAVFRARFPQCRFVVGQDGLCEIASLSGVETVVMAIAGFAGLYPTLAAIRSGKRLLSANKEAIVAAGEIVNHELRARHAEIVPLDSEHNAVYAVIKRLHPDHVEKITLTASGGPFRTKPLHDGITKADVLSHPTWDMGSYITVNSATLMNKGFEVIEAHYLFGLGYDRIDVLVHPQSLTHGIVETIDGTQFMVTSPSDMRYPIALALFAPGFPQNTLPRIDLTQKPLEFFKPDLDKFPLLRAAYETGKAGGVMPAVLNAANEVAVEAFLQEKIGYTAITRAVLATVERLMPQNRKDWALDLNQIQNADQEARLVAESFCRG